MAKRDSYEKVENHSVSCLPLKTDWKFIIFIISIPTTGAVGSAMHGRKMGPNKNEILNEVFLDIRFENLNFFTVHLWTDSGEYTVKMEFFYY